MMAYDCHNSAMNDILDEERQHKMLEPKFVITFRDGN